MQLNRRDNMKCQRVIARSKVYVKFKRYLCQNHSRTKMVNSTSCKLLNFFSIFTNVFKEIKFKHKFPPLIKYSIYIYMFLHVTCVLNIYASKCPSFIRVPVFASQETNDIEY